MLLTTGTRLACDRKPYEVEVEDGTKIPARAIVIATGAKYSKLPIDNLCHFEGAGIYYGATLVEAQVCSGEEVIVVGGGNSAGQAAVFLAEKRQMEETKTIGADQVLATDDDNAIANLSPVDAVADAVGGKTAEIAKWG